MFRSPLSASGRYIAFESAATNIVANDTNGFTDIFVRNMSTGVTERVSVGPAGLESDAGSDQPAISADGRFVAFSSQATNLAPAAGPATDVFVRDRVAQTTFDIAEGHRPVISAHGRFVAFDSNDSTLVPGDTNGWTDVYIADRRKGTIRRISVGTGGVEGDNYSSVESISVDGRFIAFYSDSTNLIRHDTNGVGDIFVHDSQLHRTERVSVGRGGVQADWYSFKASISAHGRFVAFDSGASNLVEHDTNGFVDIFVRDRSTDRTHRLSLGPRQREADEGSAEPVISAHGRYVAFYSTATNLVSGDINANYDVFVRDRARKSTELISVTTNGTQADGISAGVMISANGRHVTFMSDAQNLVRHDTNRAEDVFVRDRRG